VELEGVKEKFTFEIECLKDKLKEVEQEKLKLLDQTTEEKKEIDRLRKLYETESERFYKEKAELEEQLHKERLECIKLKGVILKSQSGTRGLVSIREITTKKEIEKQLQAEKQSEEQFEKQSAEKQLEEQLDKQLAEKQSKEQLTSDEKPFDHQDIIQESESKVSDTLQKSEQQKPLESENKVEESNPESSEQKQVVSISKENENPSQSQQPSTTSIDLAIESTDSDLISEELRNAYEKRIEQLVLK
jgi:hypothetical protein